MKSKTLAVVLSAAMAASVLTACGSTAAPAETPAETKEEVVEPGEDTADTSGDVSTEARDYGSGEIKVWVADNVLDFTKEQISAFQDAHPEFSGYSFSVEATGEGDAASNVITDVEAGADVFAFAQDQIARLVAAGALEEVAPENLEAVKSQNDAGSVKAATVGELVYAYPLTSDNGYFMYYDKSVVTDPSDLDKILADCEAAGKSFYMEINSGWYQPSFFFGTGCELSYDTDNDGNFTEAHVSYASDTGVVALKEMIRIAGSPAFVNGSSVGSADAAKMAAIVDGTWDAQAAKDALGDNYACAKLPSFEGSDGKTYQLSGFSGYKLLGVKPQEDENKLAVCDALAAYLSSGEMQLARYNAVGWGPSNLEAQKSDEVQSDEALTALNEQMLHDIPQGQYPSDYWTLAIGLGDSVINGEISSSTSDADLLSTLQDFQDTCISYVK